MTVCETKIRYDTEFEADRMAAIIGHAHNEDMKSYHCGNHYHVCHSKPEQWSKRCPHCKQLVAKGKIHKCKVRPK